MGDLTIIAVSSADDWDHALSEAFVHDVYFTCSYMSMLEANGDGEAKLAVFRSADGIVVYPFLLRDILFRGAATGYRDIASPYGYAGPIAHVVPSGCIVGLAAGFRSRLTDYMTSEGVVSEFIRFHPLHGNAEFLAGHVDVQFVRETISIDLRHPLEMIWRSSVQSTTRNMVRKAGRMGVVVAEHGSEALPEFRRLYSLTMNRVHAERYYYFSDAYFSRLAELVNGQGVVLGASFEGKLIASTVLLVGGAFAHYHLSASDPAFRSVPGTHLLVWNAISWAQEHGATCFHLGGGQSSSSDSLSRFKAGFSPSRNSFYIGRVVVHPGVYAELVSATGTSESNYFPKYRGLGR